MKLLHASLDLERAEELDNVSNSAFGSSNMYLSRAVAVNVTTHPDCRRQLRMDLSDGEQSVYHSFVE